MTLRSARAATVLLLAAATAAASSPPPPVASAMREGTRPRLAVVIAVDSLRADMLRRWADLLLPARDGEGRPGGFRWLMTEGTWFADARFAFVPNETAPGHAVLLTGADPYVSGIVSNQWLDPATKRTVYGVEDPRGAIVGLPEGTASRPLGPANLSVSTVGDALEMATAGRSKTVSIAFKDRAAILMAGHAADAAVWIDATRLRWVTSRAYAKDGALPPWIARGKAVEALELAGRKTWEPLPETAAAVAAGRARPPALPGWKGPLGMGATFPHAIPEGEDFVKGALRTPYPNAAILAAAKEAIVAMDLGADAVPDLLTIGFSSNDWIAHAWGPYAPETLDALLRTDRELAELFRFLDARVPGGLASIVVVVTSDHGVPSPPEESEAFGIGATRLLDTRLGEAAESALAAAFGPGPWIARSEGKSGRTYHEPYLWFDPAAVSRAPSRAALEEVAARAIERLPGVHAVFGRSAILEGRLPATPVGRAIARGFHPKRSGDLVVVMEPHSLTDWSEETLGATNPYPTNHSQPWAYDAEVPILLGGFGIPAAVRTERVSPSGIAPTLAILLGVETPSGSDGEPLF